MEGRGVYDEKNEVFNIEKFQVYKTSENFITKLIMREVSRQLSNNRLE